MQHYINQAANPSEKERLVLLLWDRSTLLLCNLHTGCINCNLVLASCLSPPPSADRAIPHYYSPSLHVCSQSDRWGTAHQYIFKGQRDPAAGPSARPMGRALRQRALSESGQAGTNQEEGRNRWPCAAPQYPAFTQQKTSRCLCAAAALAAAAALWQKVVPSLPVQCCSAGSIATRRRG